MKRFPKKRGLSKPAPVRRKSAAATRAKASPLPARAATESRAKTKIRLDVALVQRGLLESRDKAARLILAEPPDTPSGRTFACAVAVRQALTSRGVPPGPVNLFTHGVHARRSRLVYAKVLTGDRPVGVISWSAEDYSRSAWWHSSERTLDLLKESLGYGLEACVNSGRLNNSGT